MSSSSSSLTYFSKVTLCSYFGDSKTLDSFLLLDGSTLVVLFLSPHLLQLRSENRLLIFIISTSFVLLGLHMLRQRSKLTLLCSKEEKLVLYLFTNVSSLCDSLFDLYDLLSCVCVLEIDNINKKYLGNSLFIL